MIQTIFKNRINTLKKEYDKLNEKFTGRKQVVEEYIILQQELMGEIESISESDDIEPNIKYIEIDKRTKYIETIISKISLIKDDINKEIKSLEKEKKILVESCIEAHKNIAREKVLIEIDKLFIG